MKKFLSYVLTFALLFFITAAATVSMASNSGLGLLNPGVNTSQQVSSSSLFNGILDTFGKHKKFNIKGEIELSYKETKIPVNLYVDLDITDANNIKINGYLNVKYNDNSNVIKFSFYNNTIYLNYNENNVKLETQTIFDLIKEINNLIPSAEEPKLEENNQNESDTSNENADQEEIIQEETDILQSLMPMLMEALDNMVETKLENGVKRIEIGFQDLLDVVLVTDNNNIPKTIILETENFKGYQLFADIDLEFNDDIFILNPETNENALDYFDLKTYKEIIKNIASLNSFKSELSLSLNGKNVSFDVLANLSRGDYSLALLNNDFGYVQDLNFIFKNNNIYLNVNDINLLFSDQLIEETTKIIDKIIDIENVNIDFLLNKLNELSENINVEELDVESILGFLVCFKQFNINENELTFTIDTSVLGLELGTINFGVIYQNEEVQKIYLNNVVIDGNVLDLNLTINKTSEKVEVLNTEQYLDIQKLISNNKKYFSSTAYNLDFDLLFSNNKEEYALDSLIQFDFSNAYFFSDLVFNLNGEVVPVEIEYIGNCAYVKYNNVKLKMSKAQAKNLINELGFNSKQAINYQNILDKFSLNINEKSILLALSSLNNVEVSGNQVKLEFGLESFGFDLNSNLVIILEDEIVKEINIDSTYNNYYFNINARVLDNEVTEKQIDTNEYLDVVSFVKSFNDLLNIKEGQILVDASVCLNNKTYFAALDIVGSLEKEYLNVSFDLSGDAGLDFNLSYYDDMAYVNLNGIYVKSKLTNILELFSFLETPSKEEIESLIKDQEIFDLSIIKNDFDLSLLKNVKEILISSNEIKICLNKDLLGSDQDITLILALENNKFKALTVNNFSANGVMINGTLAIDERVVENKKVDEEKYLDVKTLMENAVALFNSDILNLSLDANLYDHNFGLLTSLNVNLNKLFENNRLLLNLCALLVYDEYEFSLSGVYQNNTTFIDLNGLKLMLETDRLQETVSRILKIINENPDVLNKVIFKIENLLNVGNLEQFKENVISDAKEALSVSTKDLFDIISVLISRLEITSNGINIELNGEAFGYEGTFDLEILLDKNNISNISVNKIKVNDKYLNVSLNINSLRQNLETISNNEKEKYINVAEFSEVIESAYNTIKTKSITGLATVKFGYNGEQVLLNINYGFKLDENDKLVVYFSTTIFDKDIYVYFANDTLYLEVQGLKTKVGLTEVPELINWLNSEFDLSIDLRQLDTFEIESKLKNIHFILGVVANMDVSSILDRIVFNENSMEIIVDENTSIFVNYGSFLDQIIVHESGDYFELNIEPMVFTLSEVDFDSFVSYESIIDIYNSVINSLNTKNNYQFNLDFNINGENVSALIQLDKDYNVQVALTNTFGINRLIITYIDGELYFKANDIYVLVTEELISDMPLYLAKIVKMFKLESGIQEIYNFITTQKTNIFNFNPLVLINCLNNITLTNTGVTVTLNGKELHLGTEITVSLTHNKDSITNISVSGLNVNGNAIGLSVGISETTTDINVEDSQKYNDIYETILRNIDFFDNGAIDFSTIVCIKLNSERIPVKANVKIDINNSYFGIRLFVDYKTGYTVSLEIQDEIYLTVNNTKVKISQQQLFNIIQSLDLTSVCEFVGSAYNWARERVTQISYKESILKVISLIKHVTLDSNEFSVSVYGKELGLGEDVKLSILLENNTVKSINLSNIKLESVSGCGKIVINSNIVSKNELNSEEYIDFVGLANNINDLLNSTQGKIKLDVNASILNKDYILDLDFEGSLRNNYLDLTASLSGGYNLFTNLTMIDGELYSQINNIFVKADIKMILGLILSQGVGNSSDLQTLEELESIINIKNFIRDFDLLDLYVIKNIKANNEFVEIIIDKSVIGGTNDLVVNVTLNNNLPTNITINNLFIDSNIQINSLSLAFESKEIEEKQFDKNKYLDLEDTVDKASELPYLNNLNAVLDLDFYTFNNEKFKHELGFEFDYKKHNDENGELWSLIFSVLSGQNRAEMSAVYENQKIFANYNGLKLMLETNEITNIVNTILSLAGIENNYNNIVSRVVTFLEGKGLINALNGLELPLVKTPDFNTMSGIALFAIENLTVSSNGLSIDIDGNMFGYNGIISLQIDLANNNISKITISKLKVENIYVDITLNLSLEEQTIQTVPEEEQEYYINVAKLTEAVEAVYKTITQDYVTGTINLSTIMFGEAVDLTIYYGIGNNNGTFEVYIETDYKGIDIKLIYQNGAIFVDIQGMRVQIELTNINNLISWIESEFGIEVDEQKIQDKLNEVKDSLPKTLEDIIKEVANVDLSFINKVEFNENIVKSFISLTNNKTMIILLKNGMTLSFGYSDKIQDVAVKFEDVEISAQIDDTPIFTESYEPEIDTTTYTSYTDLTELITLLKQTFLSNKNFNIGLEVNTNVGDFKLEALLDINNLETQIKLFENTFGYIESAEIIYKDGQVYLRVNDLYILLSEQLIKDTPDLLDNLFAKFGIQNSFDAIVNRLKSMVENTSNINVIDYLKYIENIMIKPNQFIIEVNANIFGLGNYNIRINIAHNKQEIESIRIQGLEINNISVDLTLKVSHLNTNVEIINAEQYIDIYEVAQENLEFFKTGELDLDVKFNVDSVIDLMVNGNIKLDLNNKEFGLIFNITGDYDFTLAVDYYNKTAYVQINGIKVKTTLVKVQELLSELGLNIDIENEINSLLNYTPKLNVTFDEVWNAIEKLILTSNRLELNFNLNSFNINSVLVTLINIESSLVKEVILSSLNINGTVINANILLNNNSIERNVVSENEYLDLTEAVINAKNLINKDIIKILADVKLYDNKFNEEIGLTLDLSKIFENGNLSASALINLIYNGKEFNISTIYKNNTWLANLNGLKLMLEKDRIEETVQTILSIIGKDIHSYDEIVNKVVSLLEGESLYNILSCVNISVSDGLSELDYETLIKEALKNIEISSTEIKLNIDGNVFGFDSLINIIVKLENNNIKSISVDKLKLGDKYIDISIDISEERKEVENISNEKKESYVNLAEFAKVAKATLKTFESKTISGFFTLGFTFAGERNLLNVNYGISFDKEKGYEGYIQTNFKGLDVNVYFIENKIYLDIVGLKINLTFEDINGFVQWLNKFGVEIDFDFTLIEDVINGEIELLQITDIYSILDMIFGLDMSFVEKTIFNENTLDVYFKGNLNIFVNYLDVVKQVIFQKGDIYVELNCTDFNEFALNINKEEFHSYTIVTDMVDSALELLKKKQVSMNAETLVYENNLLADRVDIALAINTQDTLNMYAGVVVNNNNTNIHFAYQDDYIFANYENLKLSLSQKSLKEILVIALEALGVDAKTIGFLGDVAEDMDLNTDNLQEIIPSLDFGNPLNMLKLIKSIDIVDGEFIITIDGKAFTGTDKSEDMTVKVKAINGDISTIKLGNVYSNGESQRFDLNINFTEYTGVKQILDKSSYIDISGSAGILKAFVNTSYLKDYSMSGIITVTAEVIGIPINMDIPVEARVKIVNGETVAYVVMDVPVIGSNVPGFTGINVNNDVPYEFGDTSVKSRKLEIMYKDEFIYFYRKDVVNQTVFASRTYEKTLKLNASEMTADLINYLLSYGLGFSDTIMAEIDKAIIKATNRADNPLDVSNILKGFSHTDGTDLYSILVNLAEIANNDLLGDALINIYTVNNEATNYKDYIGRLAFDINMPLASVCEINLKTDNLTLNNIGQTVDVSNVDSYANNYQFKENQQYEKSGGNWEFAGEKQYTIKFVDSMGNTPSDITAPVDNSISLPSLSTIIELKEDGEYTYTFAGWYLSQEFKPSDKVSYVTMPRGNRTLYAKWDESVRYYRNVTLNSMGGGQDLVIKGLEGSRFALQTLENKIVVDGQTKIIYGFTGWFINESCTEKATIYEIPNDDITLYAGWEEIDRYVAYNLKVVDNGVTVFDQYIGEGLDIELSGFTIDSYTKYYPTQDYANEYTVGKMPSNDLTLYVRNRYALNIVSAYGDLYDTTEYYYQGEAYNLPSQSNYVVDDGNTQVTYTFNGYDGRTDVMPNSNLRVVASWTVVTKHYYTVTFELCYNGNIGYYSSAKLFKDGIQLGKESVSVKVLEGNMDLSSYTATWVYKAVFYYHYNFEGWSTSKNGSAITSVNITGNTTIYGLWSGLKTGQ